MVKHQQVYMHWTVIGNSFYQFRFFSMMHIFPDLCNCVKMQRVMRSFHLGVVFYAITQSVLPLEFRHWSTVEVLIGRKFPPKIF